jgi:DNA (cytosine-5)-methyltransferase 1
MTEETVNGQGKREGLAGERSGLWHEFRRIVAELAPRWVLIENVPGLLSSNGGRDFAVILRGLDELGYGVAWRVLDSQYFGVAQRRRRVFVVGYLGAPCPPEILFEPESVSGHPAPCRTSGAGVAPLLEVGARTNGDGYRDGDGIGAPGDPMYSLQASKQHGIGISVSHAPTHEGHDASEDGTGSGTPIVMASPHGNAEIAEGVHTTLMADHAKHPSLVAFNCQQDPVSGGLSGGLSGGADQAVGFDTYNQTLSDQAPTLRDPNGTFGDALPAVTTTTPRRLTPTECERLQGFPDGWTADGSNGPQADSARYKQLGNAVTVNVAHWIGHQIAGWEGSHG